MDVRAAEKSCSVVFSSRSLRGPVRAAFLPVPRTQGRLTAEPAELPVPASCSTRGDRCGLLKPTLCSINIFISIGPVVLHCLSNLTHWVVSPKLNGSKLLRDTRFYRIRPSMLTPGQICSRYKSLQVIFTSWNSGPEPMSHVVIFSHCKFLLFLIYIALALWGACWGPEPHRACHPSNRDAKDPSCSRVFAV